MKKQALIIEIDPTEENALALLGALRAKSHQTLGICVTPGHQTEADALTNIAGLLTLFQKEDTPIYLGRRPNSDRKVGAVRKPFDNTLTSLRLPEGKPKAIREAEPWMKQILSMGEPVTYLCLGPITTLADVLRKEPALGKHIKRVILCGGAQRRGVITPVLDDQASLDPEAMDFVLKAGLEVTMVPVDIAKQGYRMVDLIYLDPIEEERQAFMKKEEIDALWEIPGDLAHQLHRLLMKRWCETNFGSEPGCQQKGLSLQDLAAAFCLEHMECCQGEKKYCEMCLTGEVTYGMTVFDMKNRLQKSETEIHTTLLTEVDRRALIAYLYELVAVGTEPPKTSCGL